MEVPSFTLLWPVVPYCGTRGIDAWGAGGFGAPRSRGGDAYAHKGLDCIAQPGDAIIYPVGARIIRVGRAYPDEAPGISDPSDLGSLHLRAEGALRPLRIKLLYVGTHLAVGERGAAGDPLGGAQDRAAYARHRAPKKEPMINHVHVECWWEERGEEPRLLNPSHYLVVL